jgi:glycine/D-amino acid oxidase-like deaminating enzyme/nitrite reductase/ring-hydroxylating ferredoxin subunit
MSAHESVWIATTEGPGFARLEAPQEFDVAVLGGGIAGLTTALLLKNSGVRVAVVEAARICGATTGHTTAKVSAQHGLIYDTLSSKFGEEGAREYAEGNVEALELMEDLVREHGIDCDWERRPAFVYAEQDSSRKQVEQEVEAAIKAGLPASYTEETELPWPVTAAIRFEDQAQFHPRRYCLALAHLIDGDGSAVFEHTRALDVEEGSPCVVKTERHDIRAAYVVLATHLPFLDQGAFSAKSHPEREYVLAVSLEDPVPKGMYISVEQPTRSVRQHPFDGGELLILGGDSHKTGQDDDTERHYSALEEFARDRFAVRAVEYRWSTQDHMTVDRVPYIGRLRRGSERLYVATGFNKWGMTNGTVAGVVISDQILGRENPWTDLFDPNRVKPLASAKSFVKENVNVAKKLVGGHLTSAAPVSPDALGPGEGQVTAIDGHQVALSRDDEGRLHVVSARCTHMGCIVNWNTAERTWDCPCHGSRFALDGAVLEGPAVARLEDRSKEAAPQRARARSGPGGWRSA